MLIVDIGSYNLKVIHVEKHAGSCRVLRADMMPVRQAGQKSAALPPVLDGESGHFIANGYHEKHSKRRAVTLVVSSALATTRRMEIPAIEEAVLQKAVEFELGEQLQMPVSEMCYDYQSQRMDNGQVPRYSVMAAAGKRTQFDPLLEQFAYLNLNVSSLHISSLSAFNLAKDMLEDGQVGILLDIGASRTTVTMGTRDEVLYTRSIDFGGEQFTEALAKDQRQSHEDAEEFKCLQLDISEISSLQALPELSSALELFRREILRTVAFAVRASAGRSPQRLFYTGGSAALNGLGELLRECAGMPAELLKPTDILKEQMWDIAAGVNLSPAYSAALGAAAQLMWEEDRWWNLLPAASGVSKKMKSPAKGAKISILNMCIISVLVLLIPSGFALHRALTFSAMQSRLDSNIKVQVETARLQRELAALKEIEREKDYWSALLMNLSEIIPKDTTVGEMNFGSKKDIQMVVSTGSTQNVANLVKILEESAYLKNVRVKNINKGKRGLTINIAAEKAREIHKPPESGKKDEQAKGGGAKPAGQQGQPSQPQDQGPQSPPMPKAPPGMPQNMRPQNGQPPSPQGMPGMVMPGKAKPGMGMPPAGPGAVNGKPGMSSVQQQGPSPEMIERMQSLGYAR